jgi:very-short-patch-repair endonuclease
MPRQRPELTRFAREMRRDPTRAEAILWWSLRGRSLGVKFRRQVPIGPYIADFACYSHRLIVEIDGLTHDELGQEEYDRRRDRWCQTRGWTVIRVTDDEVWSDRDSVLEYILQRLETVETHSLPGDLPTGQAPTLPRGG